MENHTKEFRIGDYLGVFEKSLNYMTGTIFAAFIASVSWYVSEPDRRTAFPQMLHTLHEDPKKLLCLVTALLSVLPYYFYYTLKDSTNWNMYGHRGDHKGLAKVGILYEICIMSIFYSLLQGDTRFSAAKLIAAFMNMVLIVLYSVLLVKGKIKGRVKGEKLSYFLIVIIIGFLFFLALFVNSLFKWKKNFADQDYSVLVFMMLFFVNGVINLAFLTKWDSCAEAGIISNRIKIIIPTISISIFPASLVYCFCNFGDNLQMMLIAALIITTYEIVISCIKQRSERIRIIGCVSAFAAFVFAIPCVIWCSGSQSNDLSLYWFVLVGMGIYMAAIKYGGYILRFLFGGAEKAGSEEKITSALIWFRNSVLGSMIFVVIVALANKEYRGVLLAMLVCALALERFISKNAFADFAANGQENVTKIYVKGKIGEFFAIILPPVVFLAEKLFNFWPECCIGSIVDVSAHVTVLIILICLILADRYILRKMESRKQAEELPEPNWKQVIKDFHQIKLISGERLSDKNVSGFWMLVVPWNVYILVVMIFLAKSQAVAEKRLLGMCLLLVVMGGDWVILSQKLLDKYIGKMGEGKAVVKFLGVFRRKWEKCLQGLAPFREREAEQFLAGNRLRPILFFMGSCYQRYDRLQAEDYQKIAKAACSIELIHKSSVIFDDYIDQDSIRNGKAAFHVQYPDVKVLILMGNAMLARAQANFSECRNDFECDEACFVENAKKLSGIIYHLCEGCYKELSMLDYDMQNQKELNNIIFLETVSLIRDSVSLGYRCFHAEYANVDCENLEKLGVAFGYIFQYLNDLEPFSQKWLYKRHKGGIKNFDFGRKNIALFLLYNKASEEEKARIHKEKGDKKYDEIVALYKRYNIEQKVLNEVKEKLSEIKELLRVLSVGNKEWVKAFRVLFNYALKEKGWGDKVENL